MNFLGGDNDRIRDKSNSDINSTEKIICSFDFFKKGFIYKLPKFV